MNVSEARQLYLRELPTIDGIVRTACRRRGAGMDEEDFASVVKLRLIENDYAVIRKFGGRSSFRTYLTIVVQRFLLDQRVREWGRWRPSAEARRLGSVAVSLERLLHRDGLTFDEACAVLARRAPRTPRPLLETLVCSLPVRRQRPVQSGEPKESDLTLDASAVERPAFQRDRERIADQAARLLDETIASLDAEDRLILKLRFQEELPMVEVARSLGAPRRVVHKRVRRLLDSLRAELEASGLDRGTVWDLIEHGAENLALASIGGAQSEVAAV
jgi:RNA polymerase sigma factor (sigma-70 family)